MGEKLHTPMEWSKHARNQGLHPKGRVKDKTRDFIPYQELNLTTTCQAGQKVYIYCPNTSRRLEITKVNSHGRLSEGHRKIMIRHLRN